MVASDHPGCCGAAARMWKKPGIQKLTPPSSASACFGAATTAASVIALQTKPVLIARVRAAGCSRRESEVATAGFISAPLWPLGICNSSGNDRERLTAIILHREHPDHMQMRQPLRMPVFVAKESHRRNRQ